MSPLATNILLLLLDRKEMTAGAIALHFKKKVQRIASELKVLRERDLVARKEYRNKDIRTITYFPIRSEGGLCQ